MNDKNIPDVHPVAVGLLSREFQAANANDPNIDIITHQQHILDHAGQMATMGFIDKESRTLNHDDSYDYIAHKPVVFKPEKRELQMTGEVASLVICVHGIRSCGN